MTYLSDTSSDVERVRLELLRKKTPAQHVASALQLTSDVVRASKRAIALAHPNLTIRQVGHLFVELHYGRELADAVRQHERVLEHGR